MKRLLTIACILALAGSAGATQKHRNANAWGKWSTASQWSPAGTPATTDTLFFDDTSRGDTATTATIKKLVLSSGFTDTITFLNIVNPTVASPDTFLVLPSVGSYTLRGITNLNGGIWWQPATSTSVYLPKTKVNSSYFSAIAGQGLSLSDTINQTDSVILVNAYLGGYCSGAAGKFVWNTGGNYLQFTTLEYFGNLTPGGSATLNCGASSIVCDSLSELQPTCANNYVNINSQSSNWIVKGNFDIRAHWTFTATTSRIVIANAAKSIWNFNGQTVYDWCDSAATGQIDTLAGLLTCHNFTHKSGKLKGLSSGGITASGNITFAATCSDSIFGRVASHNWTFTGTSPTLTLQGTGKRLLDSAQWVPQHSINIVMDSNNTIRAFLPTLEAAAQTWIMQASRTLTSLVSTPYAWSGQGGVADTMRSSTPGAYARMGLSTAKPCSTLYLKDMAFQSYALTCTTGCYNGGNDSNVVWDTLKVSAITPTSISTAGGPCTLTVTHGRTAGGAVTVDGGAATLLSQGAAQWRFTAPAHAAGTVAVVATSGLGGTPGTATINLEYIARPGTLAVLTSPQVDTVGKAATNQAVTHSGGTPTLYRAPTLPDGIIINSLTGQIHGAPTIASAKAGYPVYASNIAGEDTCYDTLTVLASCSTPTIIRAATQSGWVNVAITPMVTGHTGATPDSIKCRTVLPSGITCSALGTISGTSAIQSAKTGYRIVGYAGSDSSVVWDSLSVRAYPVLTTLKHPMGRVAYVDTIIGSYFGASGGAATLGGTAVTISRQTNDTLIWSVPSKARGTYDFIYTNSPSALTDTVSFRVLVPSITVTNP